jgi:hypothetical protein
MELSKDSLIFIQNQVLPKLHYSEITDDNISEIVDFIVDNFEVPLAQAKEAGEQIDEELLQLAAFVITEITTNPKW